MRSLEACQDFAVAVLYPRQVFPFMDDFFDFLVLGPSDLRLFFL